jgi:hypothetical protein
MKEKLAALKEDTQQLLNEMEAGAFGQEKESDLDFERRGSHSSCL